MTWAALAGGTAVFYALHGAWSARVSRRFGPALAGWALFTGSLPVLLPWLLLAGLPDVQGAFWPAWGAAVAINLGASYLFLSALRLGDLGLTYPLLALTPAFVVPLERWLLGGWPGKGGLAGIALVVTGVYLLNLRAGRAGPLEPLRALLRDPGARRMLVVALLWSVSGTLDRVAVLASSPAFYGFMLAAGLALLYTPLVLRSHLLRAEIRRGRPSFDGVGSPHGGARLSVGSSTWTGAGGMLLVHGLLFAAMFLLQMEAVSLVLASYVLSIKRSGAVLAVLLGYFAFREGELGPRLLGACVTAVGATVLVLFG